MYERLTKCPLCKSGLFLNHLIAKDHAVTHESFTICKCTACDLWFTNPRPDKNNISNYYEFEDYISHKDKSTNLVNILYKLVRKITIQKKLKWINEKAKIPGRLLDFGCGTGYLLAAAQKKGWESIGLEPNDQASKIASDKFNLNVYKELGELEREKKFDVITLFHVLEHIHDLNKTVKKLLDKLKKRGLIFIAVPNYDSPDSKFYRENWAALDVPRHLYHFNTKAMESLADKHDLKIVDKKPMKFDAYYISLLSDKNMGKQNLVKSLLNGYSFNKQAKKADEDYSSIMYVLKKK